MANNLDKDDCDKGWINYQQLVLEQLGDHKEILKSLISELNDIKTQMAVSTALAENWRSSVDKRINNFTEEIEFIYNDPAGLISRVKAIEDSHRIEEKSTIKAKAVWAFIGSGIVVAIDIGFKLWDHFFVKVSHIIP